MRHHTGILVLTISLLLATGAAATRGIPAISKVDSRGGARLQMSLSAPQGAGALVLTGFRGRESMSTLFSFEIDLQATDPAAIPFEAVLGKEWGVTVTLRGNPPRHFNGICSRFTQRDPDPAGNRRYRAEIVPRLWLLTRKQSSRIFQELSVPEIVEQVLGDLPGLEFDIRLEGTFHDRNYCVQYRETDFAFISRLMEEEGIFYYFEQTAGAHKLVVANVPEAHPDLPGVFPYTQKAFSPGHLGSIQSCEKTQEIRSGSYTLRDYDFELPNDDLEVRATIQESVVAGQVLHRLGAGGGDAFEIYDYPGEYAERFDGIDRGRVERPEELRKIPEDGLRTVGIRMQEEAAGSLVVRGASSAPAFVPGHKFQLTQHFNGDGKYVITAVRHEVQAPVGRGGGEYRNQFECIPEGLPFRPARTTPKPIISGTQTAVVVGPAGVEIYTDKYGRVKVQFHWDREGARDESSSCWIRIAALNAGTEFGAIHIPRLGTEVVVSFLEGDPDRPIITGSVYNSEHLPPGSAGR
ncbi:MAG: type VI secretion system tip protein TssI/VgrG [Planctomycetota bacterium]|nr:type VI secretion system tip protein TssI/VgrG [Planctomycetota bacterium]